MKGILKIIFSFYKFILSQLKKNKKHVILSFVLIIILLVIISYIIYIYNNTSSSKKDTAAITSQKSITINGDVTNSNVQINDSKTTEPNPTLLPASEWITIMSDEYNYKVVIPNNFILISPETADDRSRHYQSPDNKSKLIIRAQKVNNGIIPEDFTLKDFLKNKSISDLFDFMESEGWYAASAYTDALQYYRKCLFDGENVCYFEFSYPDEQILFYTSEHNYIQTLEASFIRLR